MGKFRKQWALDFVDPGIEFLNKKAVLQIMRVGSRAGQVKVIAIKDEMSYYIICDEEDAKKMDGVTFTYYRDNTVAQNSISKEELIDEIGYFMKYGKARKRRGKKLS